MTRTLLFLMLIALTTLCSGCGGDGYAGSCFNTADRCVDFTGSAYDSSDVRDSCILEYSDDHCPSADRVGRCRYQAGSQVENIHSFYSPGWEAAEAQNECELGEGEWLGT